MFRRFVAVLATVGIVGAIGVAAAGAENGPKPTHLVEVTKVVEGEQTPGSQFTVVVTCDPKKDENGIDSTAHFESATLTFDRAGTQTMDTGPRSEECTVEEINAGGSTSHTVTGSPCCFKVRRSDEEEAVPAAQVPEPDQVCQVTVTNVFPEKVAFAATPIETTVTFTG